MNSNYSLHGHVRRWGAAAILAAAGAAMMGVAGVPAAHADDGASVIEVGLSAASSGNKYDPAVFDYSAHPLNLFSPVYAITPTGPEDVAVTTASGEVDGTQQFTMSSLGIPVDTFTGSVDYAPLSGPGLGAISGDLGGYSETIATVGSPGTLVSEPTGFLVDEFGFGYGNVFEESMNTAGTSATVGDFLLTPFGDKNITPLVALFLPQGAGITDAPSAVDPTAFGDLLSSLGL